MTPQTRKISFRITESTQLTYYSTNQSSPKLRRLTQQYITNHNQVCHNDDAGSLVSKFVEIVVQRVHRCKKSSSMAGGREDGEKKGGGDKLWRVHHNIMK